MEDIRLVISLDWWIIGLVAAYLLGKVFVWVEESARRRGLKRRE